MKLTRHCLVFACLLVGIGCRDGIQKSDLPGVYMLNKGQCIEIVYLNGDGSYRQVMIDGPQSPVVENGGAWSLHQGIGAYILLEGAVGFDPFGFSRDKTGLDLPVGYVGGVLTLYLDESGETGLKRIGDLGNKLK